MRPRIATMGAGLALAVIVAAGCGGGDGDSCTDECTTIDEVRCYGSVIEVCAEGSSSCNEWVAQTYCNDTDQFCDDASGTPECVSECSDECSAEGDSRCIGTLIQDCSPGSDGCLDWMDGADCGDSGQACDDSGTDAMCIDECTDECLGDGSTRCEGTVIQSCALGSDGCYDWEDGTDCNDSGEGCDDSSGSAACYTPCTSTCDTEGESQCSTSDVVEVCLLADDGCTYWTDVIDCTTTGYFCDDTSGDAYCIRPCTDECDTESATQCDSDFVQTCSRDTWDSCLYWTDTTDCTTTGQVCMLDSTSGTAACEDPVVILLMGDDVTTTGWDAYRGALTSAGVTWDEWDLDSLSFPTDTELAAYEVLIWFDESTFIPGNTQCQIVADWLGLGGKSIFVTSVDFLWDMENGTPGMGEHNLYLLFETPYMGDYSSSYITALDGVSADPITDPFSTTALTLSGTSDSSGDYADETTGLATKAAIYGAGGSGTGHAGISYYDSGSYKTVWLGINFHNGLSDATQQATLMDNILTWLGY